MDAAAELGRNPVSKHQIQLECGDEQADTRRDWPKPSYETEFSGMNADRKIFIFPVQLTTSRIDNLAPVDQYSCCICVTIHTYIYM